MLLLKIKTLLTSKHVYIVSADVASSKSANSELASEIMTLLKSEYILGWVLPPGVLSSCCNYKGWTFPFFLCDES